MDRPGAPARARVEGWVTSDAVTIRPGAMRLGAWRAIYFGAPVTLDAS